MASSISSGQKHWLEIWKDLVSCWWLWDPSSQLKKKYKKAVSEHNALLEEPEELLRWLKCPLQHNMFIYGKSSTYAQQSKALLYSGAQSSHSLNRLASLYQIYRISLKCSIPAARDVFHSVQLTQPAPRVASLTSTGRRYSAYAKDRKDSGLLNMMWTQSVILWTWATPI